MSGFILIHRSIFDHPLFVDEKKCRQAAFEWLLAEAEWQPRDRKRVGNTVSLERGQLAHSLRYMARAWKWDASTVQRYLKTLEDEGMIKTDVKHGLTRITICNYDKYQGFTNTYRNTSATGVQQVCNKEEQSNNTSSSPPGGLIDERAEAVATELEGVLNINREFVPPEWRGAQLRISAMLRESIPPEIIILGVKQRSQQMIARGQSPPKSFAYYEKAIAEAFARAQAPVPKAKIIPAETFEVKRVEKLRGGNSVQDAARANRERLLASFARDGPDDSSGR